MSEMNWTLHWIWAFLLRVRYYRYLGQSGITSVRTVVHVLRNPMYPTWFLFPFKVAHVEGSCSYCRLFQRSFDKTEQRPVRDAHWERTNSTLLTWLLRKKPRLLTRIGTHSQYSTLSLSEWMPERGEKTGLISCYFSFNIHCHGNNS